jgi:hypothetical protein
MILKRASAISLRGRVRTKTRYVFIISGGTVGTPASDKADVHRLNNNLALYLLLFGVSKPHHALELGGIEFLSSFVQFN